METKELEQLVEQIALRVFEKYEKNRDQLFTITEASQRLKVSRRTIYSMMKPNDRGAIQIRPIRVNNRIRFTKDELDRFLNPSQF